MSAEDALLPEDIERVAALRALALLDTPREERFDRITRTAQRLLKAPIAMVTLVDTDRQWFKSCQGLDGEGNPRSVSFCSYAVRRDDLMVVPDALDDARFATNPLVLGPPFIRFYMGMPLHSPSGHRVGTLCVIDPEPRTSFGDDGEALTELAAWAELELGVVTMSNAIDRVEKMKDEIISVTGHELRTPLTAIRGSLGLLDAGVGGALPTEGSKLVDTALRNTDRLIRLVNEMLDLERLSSGHLPMQRVPVSLSAVAATAVESLHNLAVGADVSLSLDLADDAWTVGEADRLTQVVSNLVDNAVKFSPAGATVEVRITVADGAAVVSVRDSGIGLSDEDAARIFGRFTQLDSGSDRAHTGSGLGLAIVAAIAQAHDGTARAANQAQGGADVWLNIPLMSTSSGPVTTTASTRPEETT